MATELGYCQLSATPHERNAKGVHTTTSYADVNVEIDRECRHWVSNQTLEVEILIEFWEASKIIGLKAELEASRILIKALLAERE